MSFEDWQAANEAVIELRDFETDEDRDCSWCWGEGFVECNDPIQCTRRHIGGRWDGLCECAACRGSGRAKDQTLW